MQETHDVLELNTDNETSIQQAMLLAGAVLYPLWAVYLLFTVPGIYVSPLGRMAVGAVALCFWILSKNVPWFTKRVALLRHSYAYLIALHQNYLVIRDGGSEEYALGILVASVAVSMLFSETRPYVFFTIFFLFATTISVEYTNMPGGRAAMVYGGVICAHTVIGLFIHARMSALSALVSERINTDRLKRELLSREAEEARQTAAQLHEQAYYDPLTGLANRALFMDTLNRSFSFAGRRETTFGVLFVDLDGFKEVNDRYGHAAGDELLQEFGKRFVSSLRSSDFPARLGGDEFVAVLTELGRPEDARVVCERILESLDAPIEVGAHRCTVGASIGIAVTPHVDKNKTLHIDTPADLLKCADTAMYVAKQSGKNRWITYKEEFAFLNSYDAARLPASDAVDG